jgi:hypothetical protein
MGDIGGWNGTIEATIPPPLASVLTYFDELLGRNEMTGKFLQGSLPPGSNKIRIRNYDNSFPLGTGSVVHLSGILSIGDLL